MIALSILRQLTTIRIAINSKLNGMCAIFLSIDQNVIKSVLWSTNGIGQFSLFMLLQVSDSYIKLKVLIRNTNFGSIVHRA